MFKSINKIHKKLLLPGFAYSQNLNLNWVKGFKQRCKIHEEMGQRGLTN